MRWILQGIALFFISLATFAASSNNDSFQFNLITWGGYGWTNGYLQIPYGGRPGTSSIERPTFSEAGIDGSGLFNIAINALWHNFGMYGAYLYNRPSGKTIVSIPLATHNVFLTPGVATTTNTRFDVYRFGINYLFYLCHDKLILYPLIEGTVVDFLYEFQTPFVMSSRGFHPMTFRIGFGGNYFFTKQFGLDFQLASSIPDALNTNVYSGALHFNYQFLSHRNYKAWIFIGLGFLVIQFEDQQSLPNHVNFRQWPILEGGLAFHF